jgi:hypothetical protein
MTPDFDDDFHANASTDTDRQTPIGVREVPPRAADHEEELDGRTNLW